VNGGPNPYVGAAAADIGHGRVDIRITGVGIGFEERRRRHDLAGLAVAALWHFMINPRLLESAQLAIVAYPFDGRDCFACYVADGDAARSGDHAVYMDGASATCRNAAAKFGARQPQLLADRPEKRCIGFTGHADGFAVYRCCYRHRLAPRAAIAL
jgi:hypothetical protein